MSRVAQLGLLIVLVAGAGLRVFNLGAESLWLDEACSIEAAHKPLAEMAEDTALDVHPPFYYVALHYWVQVAGDSELSARLLSALFSTLAILVIYRLATLLFGPPTGLAAAALLALSPFHLAAAQEARMYALLSLLSVWSMYEFVRLMDGADSPRRARFQSLGDSRRIAVFVSYVIATALMLYTHVYGFFVLGAQVLFLAALAVFSRAAVVPIWKRVLLAQAAAFLLFLPWLEVFFQQLIHVQHAFWIPPVPPAHLGETVVTYAGAPALAWVLVPLALFALVFEKARRWPGLLGLWIFCLVALPFVVSLVSAPIFLAKYTIAGSLAFVVLAARGLTLLPVRALGAALAVVIAVLSVPPIREYYATLKKDNWRQAVARIDALARPGDLVIFNQPYGQVPFDYYARRADLVEEQFLLEREGLTTRSILGVLKVMAHGSDRVWLVLSSWDPASPLMVRELQAIYDVAAHVQERGVEGYLFVARTGGR